MNTRNEEDIPTRNFKKKKKQQKHPKLETDDFPRETKQNKKKKGTKKKTKKNKNEKQQQPAKHREKFSNGPAELTSGKQNGRGISFSKTLSFNTFSLPNLQNKVTFFKLSLTLLLFRFLSPHGLSLPLPH